MMNLHEQYRKDGSNDANHSAKQNMAEVDMELRCCLCEHPDGTKWDSRQCTEDHQAQCTSAHSIGCYLHVHVNTACMGASAVELFEQKARCDTVHDCLNSCSSKDAVQNVLMQGCTS